ncbi:MAG TPA: non-canonical purine NTP pyrophosphatase [Anaerolineales bacterium]|nr:non-canonical purine NTP pyrophosphatase [Anaerolineales bacterium]
MPAILFATHNPWKALLFRPAFAAFGFDLETLNGQSAALLPENGATALENALAKACQVHSPQHPWTFGDDAGLSIDALNGEPGLQTRRWAGHFSDQVDDQTWLDYLLSRLQGVPAEKRSAHFFSAWVLVAPDGCTYTRQIKWPFMIAEHPLRPINPGSPISSVRIGPPDDLANRQSEILHELQTWGILAQLQAQVVENMPARQNEVNR